MPLIIQNGVLLRNGSQLAASTGCCCGATTKTACVCLGSPVIVPSSMTLEVVLGSLNFNTSTCTRADAEAFFQGTYVIPFWFGDSAGAYYRVTISSGMYVTFAWYCATQVCVALSCNAQFGFSICDGTKTCYAQHNHVWSFDPPGGSSWGASIPSLCNVTTGDTTSYSISYGMPRAFFQGPLDCSSSFSLNRTTYNLTVTATPSW
jgi:hypothetical protein